MPGSEWMVASNTLLKGYLSFMSAFSCSLPRVCGFLLPLLAVGVMTAAAPKVANAQNYSKLVVFGDSISDNGNVYRVSSGFVPQSPPYYMGRFSNGPIYVDDLAAIPGFVGQPTEDLAYGGALTDTNNSGDPRLPGMRTEVNGYLASHPVVDPNALYILWGGGNDYLNNPPQTSPATPVGNLTQEITDLALHGAHKFLIANQPNLGQLPNTIGTIFSSPLNQLTAAHNALLAQSLLNLRLALPGDTFDLLDINGLYNQITTHPMQYGYTDVTHSYLATFAANPFTAGDPNTYLFWDNLHPTAPGHQLIANLVYNTVVPEPSAAAFLSVFALTGAAFLHRRRQEKTWR